MTSIWLVRHGEAAASWGEHHDPGLSGLGRSQAQAAAEALLPVIPSSTALVSSPKARALETSEPLAQAMQREVTINSAFREIDAPVPLSERPQWLRGFMRQRWSEQPEVLWQWRHGIVQALREIEQPTVIFTHFLVINAVVAHCRGDDETLLAWPDNGSQHEFRLSDGELSLVSLGREMETKVN